MTAYGSNKPEISFWDKSGDSVLCDSGCGAGTEKESA